MGGHFALLKKLNDGSPSSDFISEEIRKMDAGVRGEETVFQRLRELRLAGEFRVFPDVFLVLDDWKVQIDCLVVTARCFIVLESKNISGRLYFNEELDEFYKEENGTETPISNPYFQLMRHIRFMKEYLPNTLPQMKVTGAVIMTAKSCRIMQKPTHYPIYKLESMVERVTQIYNSSGVVSYSVQELEVVEKLLLENRSTFEYPPLCEYYRINTSEIRLGVECPGCGVLGMRRVNTTWRCMACGKNNRYAHKSAVRDYFRIVNRKITNKEFRRFCMIDSKYAASRMLNSMDLIAYGSGPSRYFVEK